MYIVSELLLPFLEKFAEFGGVWLDASVQTSSTIRYYNITLVFFQRVSCLRSDDLIGQDVRSSRISRWERQYQFHFAKSLLYRTRTSSVPLRLIKSTTDVIR